MPHFSFSWSSISRSCCRFSLVASSSSSSTSSTPAVLVVVEVDLDLDVDLDEEDAALDEEVYVDDSDEDGVGAPPFWADLEVDGVGGLVIEIEWVDWEVAFDVDAGTE